MGSFSAINLSVDEISWRIESDPAFRDANVQCASSGSLAIFAAIRRASSCVNPAWLRVSRPALLRKSRANYSIGEPVIPIGDRKLLVACFANRLSGRPNVVTDDFVDRLTRRTGIEGGDRADGHGTCTHRI